MRGTSERTAALLRIGRGGTVLVGQSPNRLDPLDRCRRHRPQRAPSTADIRKNRVFTAASGRLGSDECAPQSAFRGSGRAGPGVAGCAGDWRKFFRASEKWGAVGPRSGCQFAGPVELAGVGPFNSSVYRTAVDSGSSSRGHPRLPLARYCPSFRRKPESSTYGLWTPACAGVTPHRVLKDPGCRGHSLDATAPSRLGWGDWDGRRGWESVRR